MALHVGTSGWSYPEWKGSFYPEDLASGAMLSYYAARFDSVEVNNTFYRLPKREVLQGWAEQVPAGFSFVLKASQRITHRARLGPDAADPLAYLMECTAELGDRLGPVLFQTPPWLKKDVALLRAFLALVPPGGKCAFEFRNLSWFDTDVYDALRERGAALVVADTGEEDKDPPLVRTTDWGYARLRREEYPGTLLAEWAARLSDAAWDELRVFFKHEDAADPTLGLVDPSAFSSLRRTPVSLSDIDAVIASAKSRGVDSLEHYVRGRLAEATESEVLEATELAVEIIESVPIFLERADQEANERHLEAVIVPILEQVERYFLQPVDLIPEMTQGLIGLLDDAYLVLRILQNLDRGPDRFLDWDLEHPLNFLRRLVGEKVARKLDERSLDAMHEMSGDLTRFWSEVSHQA